MSCQRRKWPEERYFQSNALRKVLTVAEYSTRPKTVTTQILWNQYSGQVRIHIKLLFLRQETACKHPYNYAFALKSNDFLNAYVI